MARATKTTRISTKRELKPTQTKRNGRPLGSKNRPKAAAAAKPRPVTRTTRAASGKTPAPAAPKFSKAELEQQVVRLERTIARLRRQNGEFKRVAREEAREAAEAAPAPVAKTGRTAKRPAAPAAPRGARAVMEPAAAAPTTKAASKRSSKGSTRLKSLRAAKPDVAQDDAAPDARGDEPAATE